MSQTERGADAFLAMIDRHMPRTRAAVRPMATLPDAPTRSTRRRGLVARPELSPAPRWRCATHGEGHTQLATRTLPNADGTTSVVEGFRFACGCEAFTVVGRVITDAEIDAMEAKLTRLLGPEVA